MSHIIGKSFDFGGECGVAFFFMLSGFVLSYNYGKEISEDTFRPVRFLEKQLAKFYPLHVLTFVVMILLDARLGRFFEWEKLVANLLLLQSWVPSDNFYYVGNGLSWFLSDLLFFYVVFPFVYRLLMHTSVRRLLVGAVVVLTLYATLAVYIPERMINPLLYAAPWTRLLDFSIGIIVLRFYLSETGKTFNAWLANKSTAMVTQAEIVLTIAVLVSFFFYEHASLRFRCASFFWLILPAVIYLFVATDQLSGYVTKLLHQPLMQWLGGISFEIYLMHYVTMRILYSGLASIGVNEEGRLTLPVLLLTLVVIFIVSYLTRRFFVSPIYARLLLLIK